MDGSFYCTILATLVPFGEVNKSHYSEHLTNSEPQAPLQRSQKEKCTFGVFQNQFKNQLFANG